MNLPELLRLCLTDDALALLLKHSCNEYLFWQNIDLLEMIQETNLKRSLGISRIPKKSADIPKPNMIQIRTTQSRFLISNSPLLIIRYF